MLVAAQGPAPAAPGCPRLQTSDALLFFAAPSAVRSAREILLVSDATSGPVELNDAVAQAISGLHFAISQTRAIIHVEPGLPAVKGHQQALVQIIHHLIDNALKFMPPGRRPEIRIRAEKRGARTRLLVRDHGIGIAPAEQQRLFRVFERLHPATAYPGSGLGLAIVRRGIERMGGTAGLESAPDGGSTFWLELDSA